jgi:hypothetical protein
MDRKIEQIGDGDHANMEKIDMRATSKQISKVMNRKILSGEWAPETRAEIQMLKEHRAQQALLKKC